MSATLNLGIEDEQEKPFFLETWIVKEVSSPMVGAGHLAYRQTEVVTADPKRLVVLCYERAIENLRKARSKFLKGEYEEKGKAIQKALDILGVLREALDFERGGEIARNLDRLYGFMAGQILSADRRKSTGDLDQVVRMLETLKSAWEEALLGSQSAKKDACLREGPSQERSSRERAPYAMRA